VKLSLCDGCATEIAEIVGALFALLGATVGGVYVAVVVGAAGTASVPHAGEQLVPPSVNVHVTPDEVRSFVTVAFRVTAVPPNFCVVNLLVIVTTTLALMENVNVSDTSGFVTDTAVIVGIAAAPVGTVAGGV
jgi:hypothetical protein